MAVRGTYISRARAALTRWLSGLGDYRDLARDAVVYTVAGTLARSVSVLIVPVVARTLSIDSFGVLETLTALQATVAMLAGVNLETALVRYFYEARDEAGRRTQVSTVTAATFGASVVCSLAIAAFAAPISTWLFASPAQTGAIAVAAAGVPFSVLGTTGLTVLRLQRRAYEFGAVTVLNAVTHLALVSGTALAFRGSVIAIVAGQAAAFVIVGVVIAFRIRSLLGARPSRAVLVRSLAFALPSLPSVVINWYVTLANRFFLVSLSTLTSAATFAAASKVQAVALALTQAFWSAWKPYSMARLHDERSARQVATIATGVTTVVSAASLLVAIGARSFLTVYAGPAYAPAALSAALLVLSLSLSYGICGFASIRLEVAERTGYLSLAQAPTVVAATVLNVLLIPLFGSEGAALAVLGSGVVQAVALQTVAARLDSAALPRWAWLPPIGAGAIMWMARLAEWI